MANEFDWEAAENTLKAVAKGTMPTRRGGGEPIAVDVEGGLRVLMTYHKMELWMETGRAVEAAVEHLEADGEFFPDLVGALDGVLTVIGRGSKVGGVTQVDITGLVALADLVLAALSLRARDEDAAVENSLRAIRARWSDFFTAEKFFKEKLLKRRDEGAGEPEKAPE
ncbi:MAG: hypothetical protein E6I48_07825 [Chloroflexi bacterium]|nr:MAG: hypothetical protein E6I48_07825 [Chloroflexota bacterium]